MRVIHFSFNVDSIYQVTATHCHYVSSQRGKIDIDCARWNLQNKNVLTVECSVFVKLCYNQIIL